METKVKQLVCSVCGSFSPVNTPGSVIIVLSLSFQLNGHHSLPNYSAPATENQQRWRLSLLILSHLIVEKFTACISQSIPQAAAFLEAGVECSAVNNGPIPPINQSTPAAQC